MTEETLKKANVITRKIEMINRELVCNEDFVYAINDTSITVNCLQRIQASILKDLETTKERLQTEFAKLK